MVQIENLSGTEQQIMNSIRERVENWQQMADTESFRRLMLDILYSGPVDQRERMGYTWGPEITELESLISEWRFKTGERQEEV